jgi:hypothetical protein
MICSSSSGWDGRAPCTSLSMLQNECGCEQCRSVWLEWVWRHCYVCFGWFIPIGNASRLSRNPPPCFRFLDPHPRTLYRMLRLTSRRNSIRSTTQHGKENYNYIGLIAFQQFFDSLLCCYCQLLLSRHVIVGRNFGSYVTHETKHFIYFYLGQVAVLLFKSG